MKYGILTFSGIPNYGAVLQAYALCRVIRENGAECEIINYICDNIVRRELRVPPSGNPAKRVFRQYVWKKYVVRRINECTAFTISRGMVSEEVYNKNNIKLANKVYDAFISGSDMIWDSHITDNDMTYFLSFADDDKNRLAYGSSDGNGFNDELENRLGLLKKYDCIGVRESDVCKKIHSLGIDCELVSDPTMLITAAEWNKLAADIGKQDYVIVYFPNKVLLGAASEFSRKHNKRMLVIADRRPARYNCKCLHIYSPDEWLGCIKNAHTVFTDSYHGILFSLYFNKPFYTNNIGNRVKTVLDKFGLTDRYIKSDPGFTGTIDFNNVNKKIEGFRSDSLSFLRKALNISKGGLNDETH